MRVRALSHHLAPGGLVHDGHRTAGTGEVAHGVRGAGHLGLAPVVQRVAGGLPAAGEQWSRHAKTISRRGGPAEVGTCRSPSAAGANQSTALLVASLV